MSGGASRTALPGIALASGTALTLATQAAGMACALATGVVTARWLGPDGKGQVTLLATLALTAGTLGSCGLDAALMYHGRRDPGRLRELTGSAAAAALALAVLTPAVVGALVAWDAGRFLRDLAPGLVAVALAATGIALVKRVLLGAVLARGRVRDFNAANLAETAGALGLTLLAVPALGLGVPGGVLAALLPGAAVTAGLLLRERPALRAATRPGLASLASYGLRIHVATFLQALAYRLDYFIVAALLGARDVGIYSVAVALAEAPWLVSSSLSVVLFPRVAGSSPGEAETLSSLAARLTVLLSGTAALALLLVGGPLLLAIYGERFAPSVVPLLLLLPGTVLLGIGRVLASHVSASGRPGLASWASGAGLIVNVAANLALLPAIGVAGASVATTLAYAVSFLVILRGFTRGSGISWRDALVPRRADVELLRQRVEGLLKRT